MTKKCKKSELNRINRDHQELKRYYRNNVMNEYIEKNKGDKPIRKIDPASFNNEKKSWF